MSRCRGRLTAVLVAILVVASCSNVGDDEPSASRPERARPDGETATTGDGEVRIDLAATNQVMEGFGVSERVWEDPHLSDANRSVVPAEAQDEIMDALYDDLGLTRMRATLEPTAEDAGALNFEGKRNDAHVAVVQQARERGLEVFFPTSLALDWMPDEPDAYVDWAAAMLARWRDLGAEPPFFSPVNEPGNRQTATLSPEWMVEVVADLGARLRDAGLETELVIPDDINPEAAYERALAVLKDPDARPYVGAIAYHVYRGGDADELVRVKELAARYDLPVWMTEYSKSSYGSWPGALGWARRMHELITAGDVSAVDYLWGFFGSYEAADTLISMDMEDGEYQGHTLQPVYHVTGQFSRFVTPGCVRVDASPGGSSVLASAYSCPDGRVVVVAINDGDETSTTFSLTGGRLAGEITATRTGSEEAGVALESIPAEPEGFSATLAPGTVTTFVGRIESS